MTYLEPFTVSYSPVPGAQATECRLLQSYNLAFCWVNTPNLLVLQIRIYNMANASA